MITARRISVSSLAAVVNTWQPAIAATCFMNVPSSPSMATATRFGMITCTCITSGCVLAGLTSLRRSNVASGANSTSSSRCTATSKEGIGGAGGAGGETTCTSAIVLGRDSHFWETVVVSCRARLGGLNTSSSSPLASCCNQVCSPSSSTVNRFVGSNCSKPRSTAFAVSLTLNLLGKVSSKAWSSSTMRSKGNCPARST
mmetsp:Transcript_95861/g.184893  ORF Transcript_95861/g.184893 Transcript_95861/m.184893 type:complete len:200 (-) Transcript_95861:24-623(-)